MTAPGILHVVLLLLWEKHIVALMLLVGHGSKMGEKEKVSTILWTLSFKQRIKGDSSSLCYSSIQNIQAWFQELETSVMTEQ